MHLAYDKGNQLVQVTVQEQGKHITQSYRYDAFGRRLAKYNDPGSSQTSKGTAEESGTDYFGWDGDRLVHTERLGSGNAKNDTDTLQPEVIHTVYEPRSFTPLVQLRRAAKAEPDLADELIAHMQPGIAQDALRGMLADIGATNALVNAGLGNLGMAVDAQDFIREQLKEFEETVNSQREDNAKAVEVRHYLCDHLGMPNALANDRGQIEWAAMVDVWGNVKEKFNSRKLHQPIRLPGQQKDSFSGLSYNRHRYFDADNGSYINQDPIGLFGGMNLSEYPGNPIEFTDPLGLQKYGRRSNTGHYGLSKAKPPKPDPTSTGKIADGWEGMKGKMSEAADSFSEFMNKISGKDDVEKRVDEALVCKKQRNETTKEESIPPDIIKPNSRGVGVITRPSPSEVGDGVSCIEVEIRKMESGPLPGLAPPGQ